MGRLLLVAERWVALRPAPGCRVVRRAVLLGAGWRLRLEELRLLHELQPGELMRSLPWWGSLPACLLACLLLAALGLQFARGCLCLASTEPCPTALKGQLPSEAFKQTAAVVAASLAPTP